MRKGGGWLLTLLDLGSAFSSEHKAKAVRIAAERQRIGQARSPAAHRKVRLRPFESARVLWPWRYAVAPPLPRCDAQRPCHAERCCARVTAPPCSSKGCPAVRRGAFGERAALSGSLGTGAERLHSGRADHGAWRDLRARDESEADPSSLERRASLGRSSRAIPLRPMQGARRESEHPRSHPSCAPHSSSARDSSACAWASPIFAAISIPAARTRAAAGARPRLTSSCPSMR